MSLANFEWTDRVRPIVEIGIGDNRIETSGGQWDLARWDTAGSVWSGVEPTWLDVTCDAFSYSCQYGRARTVDRFVAGTATVVVHNATGWADPHGVEAPGTLTMRPGRPIRLGVVHTVFGTRWLFRGFIDAMNPIYDPVEMDTVELSCIDALGEVNRVKLAQAAVPAGDTIDVRVGRILDAALWPATKRDLAPASDTLIASDLAGQVADLLGQAADSGGGAVFGDLDANVVFRARDWQTFVPGTPPDGSIGNVDPAVFIPGTPEIPGYLTATVGTVSTPDIATGTVTADPADAATYTTTTGPSRIVGTNPSGTAYPGAIHWMQLDRAEIPAVPAYLTPTVGTVTTPDPGPLPSQCTFVFTLRNNVTGPATLHTIACQWPPISWMLQRAEDTGRAVLFASPNGSATNNTSAPLGTYVPGDETLAVSVDFALTTTQRLRGWRYTAGAWAAQGYGGTVATGGLFDSTAAVIVGKSGYGVDIFDGRIYSVELRTGLDPSAGSVLWRFDASDYPGTGTSYVDPRGRTWTLTTAAAITPPTPAVPASVAWRFDASDYPGTGTSYVDPRGRTWTLSAAGAITPTVPAIPDRWGGDPNDLTWSLTASQVLWHGNQLVWFPAPTGDVCPTRWERPFARTDLTTRVIIGRDAATAQLIDDTPAQLLYGIEPFERTDLLTESDADITRLGQRIMRTRAASTAPRIRSVTLDARTAVNALDLMTTVDVYQPSRYRCRLRYPRGDVFDAEHFATAVAHDITPAAWTLELNLDLAAPWAAAGGRWDGAYWDQATWTDDVALLEGIPA